MSAIDSTDDKWARLECPAHYPVLDALKAMSGVRRVGVLASAPDIATIPGRESSSSPQQITEWRNRMREDKFAPTLLVGDARGNEEAGLSRTRVVSTTDVVRTWTLQLRIYVDAAGAEYQAKPLRDLLDYLLEEAANARVDAVELEPYLASVLEVPGTVITNAGSHLWRLGLLPDSELLGGTYRARLALNRETVDLLTYPPDSQADTRRVARIQDGASPEAAALRRYAASLERADLAPLDLGAVRSLLDGVKRTSVVGPKPLLELLDMAAEHGEEVVESLAKLGRGVRLDGTDIELRSAAGEATPEVRVELENNSEHSWTQPRDDGDLEGDLDSDGTQILIGWVETSSQQPDRLDAAITGQEFHTRARQQDETDGVTLYAPLAQEYVEARAAIGRLEGILTAEDQHVLELLVTSDEAREVGQRYLDAWSALLRAASRDVANPPLLLMDHLPLLDGRWVVDSIRADRAVPPRGGTLASFHPWRLAPLLKLATYARTSLGDRDLSGKLKWALDRAVPVYPLIWPSTSPLSLASYARGIARFELPGGRVLVPSSSGTGVVQVVRSFLSYHPYAKDGLVVTLVNPPPGGGLPAAIRQIQSEVGRVMIRVVTTVPDTAELDGFDDVEFVGRFPSLESWANSSPAPCHVLFAFSETLPSSSGSNLSAGQPLRGSHVSLKIEARATALGGKGLRPQLTLCPRDDNEVVLLQRNAARLIGGDPALVDTIPTLPDADLRSFAAAAASTEWLIIGVPGPVGVVAQADVGDRRRLIGREDFGPYGLYVYADGAYAVRRFLGTRVVEAPIEFSELHLDAQIERIAENSPRQILGLARRHEGVTDTIGVFTALDVEPHADFSTLTRAAYSTFYLSMDEIGWTRHWLGPHLRCDFLRVDVARDRGAEVCVRMRALEAKASRQSSGGEPSAGRPPWKEAVEQVRATLDNLHGMYRLDAPNMIADLRFTSFCEHLFSVAISKLLPIQNGDLPVLEHLSGFSARTLPMTAVVCDGVAVSTFYSELSGLEAAKAPPRKAGDWDVTVVKATSRAVNAILTGSELGGVVWHKPESRDDGRSEDRTRTAARVTEGSTAGTTAQPSAGTDDSFGRPHVRSPHLTRAPADAARLAEALFAACQRRGFRLGEPTQDTIAVGPTLVAISLPLVAGASISEIVHSEKDLAREVGVSSIDIGNDPERPFYVRFVTLRPEREFPMLPRTLPATVEPEGDLYLAISLGQDERGQDKTVYASTWPHALVGGTTGSGKTTLLRSIVRQVGAVAPRWAQLVVVDGKGESDYFKLVADDCYVPRWVGPQREADSAVEVMEWAVKEELPRRRAIVRARAEAAGTRFEARGNYVEAFRESSDPALLPLLIVIDEFGDLMLRGKRRAAFEEAVQAVGATGRSALVHMILATQRPEQRVVPGIIKGNLPCRIALQLPTTADSMTILGHGGAEHLAGKGDLILEPPEGSSLRLQSYDV
ncbi:MAG: FtsK/SpoIIIE domain-containing protein [Candidatus Dormibacteria bacterium]